uniref:Uncharacterized protein n=1 Tax=Candidatus Kentrum sp. DK TaxID=2126562 RepID=A0A450SWX8_9GAMM|nr:MAG: hypothetical protein BECKDK2373B_GA0170837_107426 [Candidatus Kentron sp. DK]
MPITTVHDGHAFETVKVFEITDFRRILCLFSVRREIACIEKMNTFTVSFALPILLKIVISEGGRVNDYVQWYPGGIVQWDIP